MNLFFNSCRRQRRDISLLVAGVLPESGRDAVQQHLAVCPACRQYHDEIKTATAPLASLREDLAALQPTPAARERWAAAIQAVAVPPRPASAAVFAAGHGFSWREVLWPYRRVWAGLAPVWVVIIVGNLSLRGPAPAPAASASPAPQMTAMAFKDRQNMLAEVMLDHPTAPEASRPKIYPAKPRSDRAAISAA